MIISIISKTEISSLEISELQNYYAKMSVIPISRYHIVVKTDDVVDITPDVLYTSLSVESLSEFMYENDNQEEIVA